MVKKKTALRDIRDCAEIRKAVFCFFYKSNFCEFIHENINEERPAQIDMLIKKKQQTKRRNL